MTKIIVLILIVFLFGCGASVPVKPEIKTVYVPVPTPCIDELPEDPVFKFGKGEKPANDAEKARILIGDFELLSSYTAQLKAKTVGCVKTKDPFK